MLWSPEDQVTFLELHNMQPSNSFSWQKRNENQEVKCNSRSWPKAHTQILP
jgi:hypothetical protein